MQELKVRAKAADVAKFQFLATVSHEIRTPMNGVLGMLAMLLDTDLGSNQRGYAQTAQACGKALIQLINEVLDRAKIEAGKLELDAVPFDLRSVLDDVLSLSNYNPLVGWMHGAQMVAFNMQPNLLHVPRLERGELERLEKLVNKYERGQIQPIDWLDRLTFKAMEKIKENETCKNGSSHLNLIVDFYSFEHRVVFQESGANFFSPSPVSSTNEIVTVWDPEVGRTNPFEHKQLKLARSLNRGIIDKDLKPSSNERNWEKNWFAESGQCIPFGASLQDVWTDLVVLVESI